jgi:AmmeMemoRadiSam system protein A
MDPGRLPEPLYSAAERATLIALARSSIAAGLQGQKLAIELQHQSAPLCAHRASFVTLHRGSALRGCVGTLEARRALVLEVAEMAQAAAFRDPRFPPLREHEFADIELQISVLSAPEPMRVDSEQALLAQLRPGIDGLILREGPNSGTFLPSVWEQLPDPREFLRRLKLKAGLEADHWSAQIAVARYTAESIP